jgi:branched-chain amino acid transport system substrate-binding protein
MNRRAFLCGLTMGALAAPRAVDAQPPIRIGATLALTGGFEAQGHNQLRGYELCVKHLNDKGGVLGRKLEVVHYDDRSDPATAVRLYEKLITQDKVDLVLGPYSSHITDAVADVSERYKRPMVAPTANVTSLYRKGRTFIFSVLPPAELYLEGLIELAARKGLKTVALLNLDDAFGRAVTQGTIELAKKKGLQVAFVAAYPVGTADFSTILAKVRAASPDVLGGATHVFEDAVAITRQLKALNVNPRMFGLAVSGDLLYGGVGRDAEFAYGAAPWVPELVEVRAGGLIPIAAVPRGTGEAIRRAGSLDGGKLRNAISKMDHHTVFGGFRVDREEVQIADKMLLFQWQEGKKVIVWPEELAPGTPRFPTPSWGQRS